MNDEKKSPAPTNLLDEQITTRSGLTRRAVLATAAGAVAATLTGAAEAQTNYTGVTDRDSASRGPNRDHPGYGRSFSGPNRLPNRPYTGWSDRDPTDAHGHGQGMYGQRQRYTGYSDRDPTDAAGYGIRRNQQVRCTDRDPGDPINGGRHCR